MSRLKPSICNGLSRSWFISSCVGIYLKYFLIYKCSKKTPENYNYMIKNITTKLAEKNIFFIKIFQAFANNNNVMDKNLFNYFIQYTDNVTYDTTEIDYNGLYDLINIARTNGDELLIDSEQPIKSGNIALVYNGRLNGKRIIIKYRRKNIETKFKKSMEELQILINITKHMPYLSDLNINDLFEENYQIMLNQLIFSNEVKNIEMFYDKFKDVENICIPKVYSYFTDSNPEVIVMDYIEGKRIEHIDSEDKDDYSRILSRVNLKCVFYDAIYHADLHSGNVIFIKDDGAYDDSSTSDTKPPPKLKIGVIDYGIIGTMTREEQNVFFMFFKVLVSKNYRDLAQFIVENLSDNIYEYGKNKWFIPNIGFDIKITNFEKSVIPKHYGISNQRDTDIPYINETNDYFDLHTFLNSIISGNYKISLKKENYLNCELETKKFLNKVIPNEYRGLKKGSYYLDKNIVIYKPVDLLDDPYFNEYINIKNEYSQEKVSSNTYYTNMNKKKVEYDQKRYIKIK